ncbi:MAG: DUF4412 domain-containing protein [Chitinophagaceae bacterium]
MKKLPIIISMLLFTFALAYSTSVRSQILKNILNTVKQTAQDRANNKASQATNKVLDKADSATQIKSKNGSNSSAPSDTSATNKVLGAFGKAASDNPNDTSAADVTMKALGNLIGGGGVSAADSAAAIKTFTTANGGSGVYLQFTITMIRKQTGTTKNTMTSYLTSSGEARTEMNLAAMMGANNSKQLIGLARASQPGYSLFFDDDSKTYSLNVIDTSLINSKSESYQVTKIGNETVQGYNCVHAKVISTTGKGMFHSTSTMDIWTSTDVPGYAFIKKTMTYQNVKPQMMQALDQAGCGGFLVKMSSDDKGNSVDMVLTTAENKSFPASLFKIPAGYTESKGNLILMNLMQAGQSAQHK